VRWAVRRAPLGAFKPELNRRGYEQAWRRQLGSRTVKTGQKELKKERLGKEKGIQASLGSDLAGAVYGKAGRRGPESKSRRGRGGRRGREREDASEENGLGKPLEWSRG